MTEPEIAQLKSKLSWRILPFIFLLYIIAYLDRANVAFVKNEMSAALGFSEEVFGFGAGIFFVGYLVLEIPSTIAVERSGARRLLARILITWGACAVATAFVKTPTQFFWVRFLLGVAEGGFFPGIIVYLAQWFTPADRSRALAGFIIGIPVAMGLGGPISAWILGLNWLGLHGWQWVFILEGIPAIAAGIVTLFYVTNRPEEARWLSTAEKNWLVSALAKGKQELAGGVGHVSIWRALAHPSVLLLAFGLFFANIANYCFVFWLPASIQKVAGQGAASAAAWSGVPFAFTVICMFWWARSSDRTGRRKFHAVFPLILAGIFLTLSALPNQSFPMVLTWLSLTAASAFSFATSFWVLPHMTLTATAAAAAIGMINLVGNLGGFVGPYANGALITRGYPEALRIGLLASSYIVGALLVAAVRTRKPAGKETIPAGETAEAVANSAD